MNRAIAVSIALLVICVSVGIVAFAVKQDLIEISEQHCLVEDCQAYAKLERPSVELFWGDGCCVVISSTSQLEGAFDGTKFLLVIQLPNELTVGDEFQVRQSQLLRDSSPEDQLAQSSAFLTLNSFVALRGGPRSMEAAVFEGPPAKVVVLASNAEHVKLSVEAILNWEFGDIEKIKKDFILNRVGCCTRIAELPSERKLQRKYRIGRLSLGELTETTTSETEK